MINKINLIKITLFLYLISSLLIADSFQQRLLFDSPVVHMGGGGAGMVYLYLYNSSDPKIVALKKMHYSFNEILKNQTLIANLINEICFNYTLYASSFIANTFNVSLKNQEVFFSQEPVLGGSADKLESFFRENPSLLSLPWLQFFIARIGLGISYIHSRGWLWLDASPKNILLDHETGYPKIADFDNSARIGDPKIRYNSEYYDWLDLGKIVLKPFLDIFNKNAHLLNKQDQALLTLFDGALERLSKEEAEPGNVKNLDEFKSLSLFNGFDWSSLEDGTMASGFIPKDNIGYLNEVYQKNLSVVPNIINNALNPLSVSSIDRLTTEQELLTKLKKLKGEQITSIEDLCLNYN